MATLPRTSRPTSPPRIDLLVEPPALYKTQVTQQKLVKFEPPPINMLSASHHRQYYHIYLGQNDTAFIDSIFGS